MVPGVKEARALSALLKAHPIFGQFDIVNVAGDGDEEVETDNALKMVEKAMGPEPEDTRTITLSCGKLTTGVTVRPWTAVMMLAGSHNTDAKAYMQTIFRVQSPYTTNDGRRKENCYVFDFAPDRTLKVLADTAKVQTKKTASESDRVKLGEFLNFCPVIGYNGTQMAKFNVENMLEQLKRAYISRVTRNGCDDPRLYNQEMLRKLDAEALTKFKNLHAIIGATKANHTSTDVDMAKTGLTNEQYAELERIKKKKKAELTEEEKRRLEEAKEKKKNADNAISILRGISIRLPLLMYGAELTTDEQDVTLENFTSLIDDQSWEEFMPRGVTKELFAEFVPYYDPDMFRAVSRNYRDLVRAADKLTPLERTRDVARIFSYFRNPDKETVLTPWRVVNMHIGDCIGGQVFFDTDMQTEGVKPRFVDHGEVTTKVFKDPNTRILEINSKTGLYPLYMAYSVFAEKLQAYRDKHMLATDVPAETQNKIWDDVLRNHIFVICKTEMAKSITKRTLRGFRQAKVNARYFEDLINKITNQPDLFITKVKNGINYWNNKELESIMKFNAIVGNPPYQVMDGGNSVSAKPVYNYFVDIARRLNPDHISMIMPSRWFVGGKGLDSFRESMLHDRRIQTIFDYEHSSYVFPGVDIAGGVCYFMWNKAYSGKCAFINVHDDSKDTEYRYLDEFNVLIRQNKAIGIVKKVQSLNINGGKTLESRVSSRKPFGLPTNYEPKNTGTPCWFIQRIGLKYANPKDWTDDNKLANKWKLLVPKAPIAGQTDFSKPVGFYYDGNIRIARPGEICTESFIVVFAAETEQEVLSFKSYLFTKIVRFLLLQCVVSQDVTKQNYAFVPDLGIYSGAYSDALLCKEWGITKDEWDYIDSKIKAVGDINPNYDNDALFDRDDVLNPNFGNFELLEYGVSIGDRIVYTPTGTECIVSKDNKLEVDGVLYSLSQFTAKFMPRNKRSISGVCQGPKYFSYNGMTLYQLKESFLGGQK